MVHSTTRNPQTLAILYDSKGRIVCSTHAPEPYTHETIHGLPAWEFVTGNDVLVYKAAIFTCLESGQPQTIDVGVNHVGRWRVTLYPCHAGRVRICGLASRWPDCVLDLTERQRQICGMLATGMGSKEIAKSLSIARETVDNHRAAISRRIGIRSSALVAWCGEHRYWLEQI